MITAMRLLQVFEEVKQIFVAAVSMAGRTTGS